MSGAQGGKVYNTMRNKKNDYWTPKWAVELIIPKIPKDVKVIWECCCGEYWISKVLEEYGYKVISTDIRHNKDHDMLKYEPKEEYDLILTNPPFNLKNEILERCYQLDKPFLLLMPLGTLESRKRMEMFKKYGGITYFQPIRRINFYSTYKKKVSASPMYSLWFGHKIEGYPPMTFHYLD